MVIVHAHVQWHQYRKLGPIILFLASSKKFINHKITQRFFPIRCAEHVTPHTLRKAITSPCIKPLLQINMTVLMYLTICAQISVVKQWHHVENVDGSCFCFLPADQWHCMILPPFPPKILNHQMKLVRCERRILLTAQIQLYSCGTCMQCLHKTFN